MRAGNRGRLDSPTAGRAAHVQVGTAVSTGRLAGVWLRLTTVLAEHVVDGWRDGQRRTEVGGDAANREPGLLAGQAEAKPDRLAYTGLEVRGVQLAVHDDLLGHRVAQPVLGVLSQARGVSCLVTAHQVLFDVGQKIGDDRHLVIVLPALVLAGQLGVPGRDLGCLRTWRDAEEGPQGRRPAWVTGQPAKLVKIAADLTAHGWRERLGVAAVFDDVLACGPSGEGRVVQAAALGQSRQARHPGAGQPMVAGDKLLSERVERAVPVSVGGLPRG